MPENTQEYQSKIKIVLITLLVAIVAAIVIFQSYQYISSYAALQGFWHVTENIYLLISDNVIKFIELATDGTDPKVLFEDKNADFKYSSIIPVSKHTYKLIKTNDTSFSLGSATSNPFNSKSITLNLYTATGTIQVMKDGAEVARLVKDNQMSNEYFSIHN